jgi:hypothetical protein
LLGSLAVLSISLCGCPREAPQTTWHTAFDASSLGWLLDVSGPAADDLYAVGGAPDAGLARHFDGEAWTAVALPAGPLLNWTHAFGRDDVRLVGNGGTVLRWDGASFAVQPTPTDQNLWGVWGASPDDVWAVGGNGTFGSEPVILHWDGSGWAKAALPVLQKANVAAFFKVWGASASDVWVVGHHGTVLHWDGAAWTEALVGASDDLISIWGTGPDHVVAVGGRGNGIVSHYDGHAWETHSLAPLPGLNGVFLRTPGVVHVVGILGTIARLDGQTFAVLDQYQADKQLDLHAVFADDGGHLTAVGGSFASIQPPYRGIALTRDLLPEE